MLVSTIHHNGAITIVREMMFHNVKPNLLHSEFRVYITGSYEVHLEWCIKHICNYPTAQSVNSKLVSTHSAYVS